MPAVGLIVPPDQPPEAFLPLAREAERLGLEELWLWEDCFAESGLGPAAAMLAATERIRVGVGLMPVPLRSVALAAMEIATVHRLFPGRFLPAIGHGVLEWMGQVGARAHSPLRLLDEYAAALRALLAGQEVTTEGDYVRLDRVQLRWPPPPSVLFVGAIGPKTLALAGRHADGVVFTGMAGPDGVAEGLRLAQAARTAAGRSGEVEGVAFVSIPVEADAPELARRLAAYARAGASRLPVVVVGPGGPPVGDERLLDFVATVAQATVLLDEGEVPG